MEYIISQWVVKTCSRHKPSPRSILTTWQSAVVIHWRQISESCTVFPLEFQPYPWCNKHCGKWPWLCWKGTSQCSLGWMDGWYQVYTQLFICLLMCACLCVRMCHEMSWGQHSEAGFPSTCVRDWAHVRSNGRDLYPWRHSPAPRSQLWSWFTLQNFSLCISSRGQLLSICLGMAGHVGHCANCRLVFCPLKETAHLSQTSGFGELEKQSQAWASTATERTQGFLPKVFILPSLGRRLMCYPFITLIALFRQHETYPLGWHSLPAL